jgi:hypothetical protein
MQNDVMVFTTPYQIEGYRLCALKAALKLEIKGLRMSRGRSAFSMVKYEFGFTGTKEKVLAQLEVHIQCFTDANFPQGVQ